MSEKENTPVENPQDDIPSADDFVEVDLTPAEENFPSEEDIPSADDIPAEDDLADVDETPEVDEIPAVDSIPEPVIESEPAPQPQKAAKTSAAAGINRNNLIIGALLIAFGLMFIGAQLLNVRIGRFIWPFFILAPGALLLSLAFSKKVVNGEPLAILGSMTTTLGLMLLYQSVTGHWASWAYSWALLAPTSIGAGLWLYGSRKNRPDMVNSGRTVVTVGLIIFLVGAVFFEMLLGISQFGGILIPLVLIVLGGLLLFKNIFKK
jgi:hypothetical protein